MRRSDEEATKLTAGVMNTLATAMVSIGVLGPLSAYLYAPPGLTSPVATWQLLVTFAIWLLIGGMLHLRPARC